MREPWTLIKQGKKFDEHCNFDGGSNFSRCVKEGTLLKVINLMKVATLAKEWIFTSKIALKKVVILTWEGDLMQVRDLTKEETMIIYFRIFYQRRKFDEGNNSNQRCNSN